MEMQKRLAVLLVMAGLLIPAAWAQSSSGMRPADPEIRRPAPKGRIHQRKVNQQRRIGQGVRSGQLTARETAKLERREAQLNKQIVHARQTGGGLSAKERARIEHKQDRLSKQIYKQKHDRQHR